MCRRQSLLRIRREECRTNSSLVSTGRISSSQRAEVQLSLPAEEGSVERGPVCHCFPRQGCASHCMRGSWRGRLSSCLMKVSTGPHPSSSGDNLSLSPVICGWPPLILIVLYDCAMPPARSLKYCPRPFIISRRLEPLLISILFYFIQSLCLP